MSIIIVGSHK